MQCPSGWLMLTLNCSTVICSASAVTAHICGVFGCTLGYVNKLIWSHTDECIIHSHVYAYYIHSIGEATTQCAVCLEQWLHRHTLKDHWTIMHTTPWLYNQFQTVILRCHITINGVWNIRIDEFAVKHGRSRIVLYTSMGMCVNSYIVYTWCTVFGEWEEIIFSEDVCVPSQPGQLWVLPAYRERGAIPLAIRFLYLSLRSTTVRQLLKGYELSKWRHRLPNLVTPCMT